MNDTSQEQLSALMDGELPRDELRFLLRRVESDASLAQRWARYHVIGAVFRREQLSSQASDRFAAAVLARLDAETPAAVRPPLAGRLVRWAGGGAIAASVAIAALLAARPGAENAVSPNNGAALASVQTTAAPPSAPIGELHQPLPSQQLLPAGFADYTQPASFESIVPNYAPRYATGQFANTGSEGFVPYVLLVGSRQQQTLEPQPAVKPAAPAR